MPGTFASLWIALGLDTTGVAAGVGAAKQQLTALQTAVGVIGISITAATVGAVKAATEFQAELNTINTITKMTDENIAEIGDGILDLSMKFGRSKDEISDGYYDLVSAGIKAKDAQMVLNEAIQLGIGGLGTTKEAVDVLTTAINTYGGDASKARQFTDELAMSVNIGKTTVHDLAQAYALVAPIAAQMGVENSELAASFGFLTAAGWKSTQVSFYMRQALNALLRPTTQLDELMRHLRETTGDVNFTFTDMARDKGLVATWQYIRIEAAKLGLSVEDLLGVQGDLVKENGLLKDGVDLNTSSLSKMIGRIQGLQYVIATTGDNFGRFNVALNRTRHSMDGIGEAALQTAQRTRGMQFSWDRLHATMDAVAVKAGNTLLPFLTLLVDEVNLLVGGLYGLITAFPEVTAVVVPLVSALGLLLALNFGAKFLAMILPLPYAVRTKLGNAIPDAVAWVFTRLSTSPPVMAAATMAGAAAGGAYRAGAFVVGKFVDALVAAWAFAGRSAAVLQMAAIVGLDTGKLFFENLASRSVFSRLPVIGNLLGGMGGLIGKALGVATGFVLADVLFTTVDDIVNQRAGTWAYEVAAKLADAAQPIADAADDILQTPDLQKAENEILPFFNRVKDGMFKTDREMKAMLRMTAQDMIASGRTAAAQVDMMQKRWAEVGPEISKILAKIDAGVDPETRQKLNKQAREVWLGIGKDGGEAFVQGAQAAMLEEIESAMGWEAAGFLAGTDFWKGMELAFDEKGAVTGVFLKGDVGGLFELVKAQMEQPLKLIGQLAGIGLPKEIAEQWAMQAPTLEEAFMFMVTPQAASVDKWYRMATLIAAGVPDAVAKQFVDGNYVINQAFVDMLMKGIWPLPGLSLEEATIAALRTGHFTQDIVNGTAAGIGEADTRNITTSWVTKIDEAAENVQNTIADKSWPGFGDAILGNVQESVVAALPGLGNAIEDAWKNVQNTITTLTLPSAEGAHGAFYEMGANMVGDIVDGGQSKVDELLSFVTTLRDILENGLTPRQVLMRLTGQKVVDDVIRGINSKKEGAVEAAEGVVTAQIIALRDVIANGGKGKGRGIKAIAAEIPALMAKGVTENEIRATMAMLGLGANAIDAIWDAVHGRGGKGNTQGNGRGLTPKGIGEGVPVDFAKGVTNTGTGTDSAPYKAGTSIGNTAKDGMNSVDYGTAGSNAANEYWTGLINRITGLSPSELESALWAKFGWIFRNNGGTGTGTGTGTGRNSVPTNPNSLSPTGGIGPKSVGNLIPQVEHRGTLGMELTPSTLAAMKAAGFTGEDVKEAAKTALVDVVEDLGRMRSLPTGTGSEG